MLCVGCDDGTVRIWWCNAPLRKWDVLAQLQSHNTGVTDVAWANSMGRSYQLIATGDKSGLIRLHKVTLNEGARRGGEEREERYRYVHLGFSTNDTFSLGR